MDELHGICTPICTVFSEPASTPVMAVSAATTPRECRITSTLGSIAADIATRDPGAPVLFIIGRVVSLADVIRPAQAMLYA